jgi:hypothetical protein
MKPDETNIPFIHDILPVEGKTWISTDGKNHTSYTDAAAANLAALLSGDNATGGGVTPALAKLIVDHRDIIIELLQSIDAPRAPATAKIMEKIIHVDAMQSAQLYRRSPL